jgi:hypothetical protein
MKNQSMFPYRRNGGKKRSKGGPGRRPHDGGGGGGRRVPGSAAELLPMLQPATKALAQMLAGNTKSSGQLVHAGNILAQANRLVDERHVDRLPPAAREEFFEQLARLKLTIADAEEAGLAPEPDDEVQVTPVEVMGADRLREVALRLAAASAEPIQQRFVPPARYEDDDEPGAAPDEGDPRSVEVGEADEATGSRLRRSVANPGEPARSQDPGTATGPRRERLRLKPLRPVGADADR